MSFKNKYLNLLVFSFFLFLFYSVSSTNAYATAVTLSGKVLDANGNGIPNQCVGLGSDVGNVITNSQGDYSIQEEPGDYHLIVQTCNGANDHTVAAPRNYFIRTVSTYSLTGTTTLNLTVPAKEVDINVKDTQGANIQNVSIGPVETINQNLLLGGLTASGSSGGGFETDQNGNTTLWLFPTDPTNSSNTYSFHATPPTGTSHGYKFTSNVTFQTNISLPIVLPDAYILSGHLYDSNGNGVADQCINFLNNDIPCSFTDSTGYFAFQQVPGNYKIRVYHTGVQNSVNLPEFYDLRTDNNYSLNANATFNITMPVHKLTAYVNDINNVNMSNVNVTTAENTVTGLSLGTMTASGPTSSHAITDSNGLAYLWLLEASSTNPYTVTAIPDSSTGYKNVILDDVSLLADTTRNITLGLPNAAPIVNSFSGASLIEGQSYSATGSFKDLDSSSWTATVNYGNGGGDEPLTLNGKNFSLSRLLPGGTYTVTVKVTDDEGAIGTQTATVIVNARPSVNLISNSTINIGNYTSNGSFIDNDSTSWTATVNYGDGTGTNPLTLSGKNFTLNHNYTAVGNYTVNIFVTDNQGNVGGGNFTVTVQRQLVALTPTNVWIGLGANNNSGIKFDIKTEVYANGVLVSTGLLNSVSGGTSTQFSGSVNSSISFGSFTPVNFATNSVLNVNVYVRNACTGSTKTSGSAKLWYNSSTANSRFGATIGTSSSSYYLSTSSTLLTAPGTSQTSTTVSVGAQCGPFVQLGSWSKTI